MNINENVNIRRQFHVASHCLLPVTTVASFTTISLFTYFLPLPSRMALMFVGVFPSYHWELNPSPVYILVSSEAGTLSTLALHSHSCGNKVWILVLSQTMWEFFWTYYCTNVFFSSHAYFVQCTVSAKIRIFGITSSLIVVKRLNSDRYLCIQFFFM